jgi:hypothetical protein
MYEITETFFKELNTYFPISLLCLILNELETFKEDLKI